MWVFTVDGSYIEPQKVDAISISMGERYAVFVKLDKTAGSSYNMVRLFLPTSSTRSPPGAESLYLPLKHSESQPTFSLKSSPATLSSPTNPHLTSEITGNDEELPPTARSLLQLQPLPPSPPSPTEEKLSTLPTSLSSTLPTIPLTLQTLLPSEKPTPPVSFEQLELTSRRRVADHLSLSLLVRRSPVKLDLSLQSATVWVLNRQPWKTLETPVLFDPSIPIASNLSFAYESNDVVDLILTVSPGQPSHPVHK